MAYLERLIDALNAPLPALKDFILPGGPPAVAVLQLARTVCRRAERNVHTLAGREEVMRKRADHATRVVDTVVNQDVQISGFLLPMSFRGKPIDSFLLVPRYGAGSTLATPAAITASAFVSAM